MTTEIKDVNAKVDELSAAAKEVEVLKREVDNKIQKAIDNPLANK